MLNYRKIRMMNRLAVYEAKEGKEDIHLSKYYKSDYVRYQVIKAAISATVGYLLILLMVAIYKMEDLVRDAVTLNYKLIGTYALAFYIITLTIYMLGAFAGYSLKYDNSRKKLARYYKMLKKLEKIYQEETAES